MSLTETLVKVLLSVALLGILELVLLMVWLGVTSVAQTLRLQVAGHLAYVLFWSTFGFLWIIGTTIQCWLLWKGAH